MSRYPEAGSPVDRFVMSEGGLYHYLAVSNIDRELEQRVPQGNVFAQAGRWFTEERAQDLLDLEFRYESVSK